MNCEIGQYCEQLIIFPVASYQEEESNSRGRCCLTANAEQNRDHHHAEREQGAAPDHRWSSAHSIQCQSWQRIAHDEHHLDETSNE